MSLELEGNYLQLIEFVNERQQVYLDELFHEFSFVGDELINEFLQIITNFNYQLTSCPQTGKKLLLAPNYCKGHGEFSPKESYYLSSILPGSVYKLNLVVGPALQVYNHHFVYLDGIISLIGENIEEKSIVSFPLEQIHQFKKMEREYRPNYSELEIRDYISAIRAVNGNEVRLVLKVYAGHLVNLRPDYHFFGKTFITTNFEGDRVWGGTVELSERLYAWLVEQQEHIEILDPQVVKRGILNYCERKLKDVKKVS